MQNSIFASSKMQFRQQHRNSMFAPLPPHGLRRKPDLRIEKPRMSTIRWARKIPSKIRPRELVIRHPHIANTLAEAWDQPRVFALLINHYLVGAEEGRQNFTEAVKQDLMQLKQYFNALQTMCYSDAGAAKPYGSSLKQFKTSYWELACIKN